jgi:excisionase family DNA binding protein
MTRYMDSAMAAEYLGLGTGARGANNIRQMVHRGEVPHAKIGTRLRFDRVEIDKWMARKVVRAQTDAGR